MLPSASALASRREERVQKAYDITTPGKQMALRLKLSKFKIALDFSQKQLLKMLLDYLTTWEKLLGNDRSNRVMLNDFYVKILDLYLKRLSSPP